MRETNGEMIARVRAELRERPFVVTAPPALRRGRVIGAFQHVGVAAHLAAHVLPANDDDTGGAWSA